MKTRKGSSRAEKPSNDEEDASSDENVKVTSKKSAKKSAKRKNVKLPLMELTKNDSSPRWLSKCQAGEDIVPDVLSRIFGEIASRIEESEGVQIGSDQERMALVRANTAQNVVDERSRKCGGC